ncbi:inhibitor of restriction endonuclease [Escherichia phage VEc74]|nr:inhibitor of restriction endonuclease [Escherichia phage VEc74]
MIIDSQSVVQYTIKIDILEKLYKFLPNLYHSIVNELVEELHLENNDFLIGTYKDLSKEGYFYVIPAPGKSIDDVLKTIMIYVHDYEIEDYFE